MKVKIILTVIMIMNVSALVLLSDYCIASNNNDNEKLRSSSDDSREGYAIIVGISDYPGSGSDLDYCDNDAQGVRSMLIDDCKFDADKIIFLQDSSATRDAISNAFDTVIAQIDSDDIFFFYFSGHGGADSESIGTFGTSIDSPHPYLNNYDNTWSIYYSDAAYIRVHFDRIELESGYDYVIVGDTDVDEGYYYYDYTGDYLSGVWTGWVPVLSDHMVWIRMMADYSLTDWGISIDSYEVETYNGTHYLCSYDSLSTYSLSYFDILLDSKLDAMNCAEKYVVSDSCHSGGMIPEVGTSDRYMMMACDADEYSLEDSSRQHGVFTYYFLRTFDYATDSNEDGVISMEESYEYCESNTATRSSSLGYTHHPQEYDGISGESSLKLNYEDLPNGEDNFSSDTLLIILVIIGVVILGIFIVGGVYSNKRTSKKDRSGWPSRPKSSSLYQSVGSSYAVSQSTSRQNPWSRPEQPSYSEQILMKATIKDLILHRLPPPKSQFSPEGTKALVLSKMAEKSLSEGNSKATLNFMMAALKLGVPEPINSQYKAFLLKVLESDTMAASPVLVAESRKKTCKWCGLQIETSYDFCINCGRRQVETLDKGIVKLKEITSFQPKLPLADPYINSIEDSPNTLQKKSPFDLNSEKIEYLHAERSLNKEIEKSNRIEQCLNEDAPKEQELKDKKLIAQNLKYETLKEKALKEQSIKKQIQKETILNKHTLMEQKIKKTDPILSKLNLKENILTKNSNVAEKGKTCSRCDSKVETNQNVCLNCGAVLKIQIVSKKKLSFDEYIEEGNTFAIDGEFNDALNSFDEALKLNPESLEVWNSRGNILTILNKPEEAIGCYNNALKIDPKDLDAWYNKALIFHKRKQYSQAEYCYNEVLKIDPDFIPAFNKRLDVLEKLDRK